MESAIFKRLKEHNGEEISRRRTALELQAKQEFIKDIGHNISAPVNSIIGMTSLLMEEKLNKKSREIVEAIQSSGNSLLSLIANVPGAIKTVHDAPEAQLGVLDIKLCINNVMDLYAIEAGEKELEISVQLEDIPKNLTSCNHNHIQQVLAHLMSNALKNTDRGSISLSASCEVLGDGAVMIEFSLADTGIGIPIENRRDIFNTFSCKADNSVAESGGAGLGLPLCKGLVEQMGGDIWIEDNEGQGTVVKFTIREELDPSCHVPEDPKVVDFRLEDVELEDVVEVEDVVELEDVNSRQKPGKTRQKQRKPNNLSKIHPLKILIVDDDDIHRKILSVQLQKLGYSADEAADGEQAVAAVMQENYDLIFMDIRMPKMNGIESTHWILERFNGNGKVRVVALTGDATNEAREQCMQAGMDNVVIKPVNVKDLEVIVGHGTLGQKQQISQTQAGTVH